MARIMVLNDGETFTDAEGCVCIDIFDQELSDEEVKRLVFAAHANPTRLALSVDSDNGGTFPEVIASVVGRF